MWIHWINCLNRRIVVRKQRGAGGCWKAFFTFFTFFNIEGSFLREILERWSPYFWLFVGKNRVGGNTLTPALFWMHFINIWRRWWVALSFLISLKILWNSFLLFQQKQIVMFVSNNSKTSSKFFDFLKFQFDAFVQ